MKEIFISFVRAVLVTYFLIGSPQYVTSAFAEPLNAKTEKSARLVVQELSRKAIKRLRKKIRRAKRLKRDASQMRRKLRRMIRRQRLAAAFSESYSSTFDVSGSTNAGHVSYFSPIVVDESDSEELSPVTIAPQVEITQPSQLAPQPYASQSYYEEAPIASAVLQAPFVEEFPEVPGVSAGFINGDFSVNEAGAAIYRMEVNIPPGTNGMQPNLSILYDSRAGNTLLGQGFSLGGLSSITRCPATKAQDGYLDGVDYDGNDRFCLDSQRLLAVDGAYGENGTIYRTENETFARITSYKVTGPGPESWKVETKSGLTYYYGRTPDSRVEASGRSDVAIWQVDEVWDSADNYMEFTYSDDNNRGESYPLEIRYTGNDFTGSDPYNKVVFVYEDRPDPQMRSVNGAFLRLHKRLSAIQTYTDDELAWEYKLSYLEESPSAKSFLSEIGECDAENICMQPTTFEWQLGEIGFEPAQLWHDVPQNTNYNRPEYSSTNGDRYVMYLDMNNDLLPDRLTAHNHERSEDGLWVHINNGNGFDEPTNWWPRGTNSSEHFPITGSAGGIRHSLIDMNRDGLPDRVGYYNYDLVGDDSAAYGLWVALNNGNGFDANTKWLERESTNWKEALPQHREGDHTYRDLIDMDGDLLPDRVEWRREGSAVEGFWVRKNNGAGFDEPVNWWRWQAVSSVHYISASNAYGEYYGLHDVNADGLPDKVNYYNHDVTPNRHGVWVYINNGDGFDEPQLWIDDTNSNYTRNIYRHYNSNNGVSIGHYVDYRDVNGDGILDRLSAYDLATKSVPRLWVMYGNGSGYEQEEILFDTSHSYYYWPLYRGNWHTNIHQTFIDLNGDGLAEKVSYEAPPSFNVQRLWVAPNHGGSFAPEQSWWGPSSDNDAHRPIHRDGGGKYSDFIDMNADGILDRVSFKNYDTGAAGFHVALGKSKSELITTIRNGHGLETIVQYGSLVDTDLYTKDNDAVYPIRDIRRPGSIVESYTVDDGVGGKSKTSFHYTGLKAHAEGLGMCGFREIEMTNEVTGIRTVTSYRQEHPYKSLPFKVQTFLADNTLIKEVVDEWDVKNFDNGTYFPFVRLSTNREYNIDGAMLSNVVTTKEFDDYGNITRQHIDHSDGNWTEAINEYKDPRNTWLVDRIERTTVTKGAPNKPSISKVAEFRYDRISGLLTEETSNVGDPLEHTKEYVHDGFGNISESIIRASTGTTRQYVYFDTTDDLVHEGQFAHVSQNAKGHIQRKLYDKRHGKVSWLTSPNGLVTQWQYDGFGRIKYEVRPDYTQTRTLQRMVDGSGDAPLNAVYYIRTDVSGSAPTVRYFDLLDRELRRETLGLDGTKIFIDSVYNNRGELEKVSDPYFKGGTPQWTQTQYDELGRPIEVVEPGADNPNKMVYEAVGASASNPLGVGLKTTSYNPLGQKEIRQENGIGQLTLSTDSMGGNVHFEYDADGNLVRTIDPAGNETTMGYDALGNRTWMIDPDSGRSDYRYNELSQLTWQRDAKGQEVEFFYDELGRMIRRVEPEGTTLWEYDTSTKGIGKLASVTSAGDQAEEYYYDDRGRIEEVITTIDNEEFITQTSYDEYSRVWKLEYPLYGSGRTFRVEHAYGEHGHLTRVFNQRDPQTVYWSAGVVNARGQLEQATLGNGLVMQHTYDAVTGFHTGTQTGSVQDLRYSYDILGNLKAREDARQCVKEQFTYDKLNRLTRSVVTRCAGGNDTVRVRYDRLGNITMKSDVGLYSYGENGAGVHAVTSITGPKANTFGYDLNGNRISDLFGTVDYSSYDKPTLITKNSKSLEFSYDANRDRYRQIERLSGNVERTKYYVGGLYELELSGTRQKEKFFIRAGNETIAIHQREDLVPDKTLYLLSDHLNSVQTITDDLGSIVEVLSFDPWGKRRNADWSPATSAISSEIDRGFTGHEQLDAVGLVHMNGRVYDPEIGRFLSPDPFVQAPEYSQSYNRYSYLMNNPLSGVDPSGYFGFFKRLVKKVARVVRNVFRGFRQNPLAAIASVAAIALSGGWASGLANAWVLGTGAATATATLGQSILIGGITGAITGSIAGAVSTAVSGGSVSQILTASLKGGLGGGLGGAALGGITHGTAIDPAFGSVDNIQQVVAHGVRNGVSSLVGGGKFEQGFISGSFMKLVTSGIRELQRGAQTQIVVTSAGTSVSENSGGKFCNAGCTESFKKALKNDPLIKVRGVLSKIENGAKGFKMIIRPDGFWLGDNFKYYIAEGPGRFYGNQYVGGYILTKNMALVAQRVATTTGVGGAAIDVYHLSQNADISSANTWIRATNVVGTAAGTTPVGVALQSFSLGMDIGYNTPISYWPTYAVGRMMGIEGQHLRAAYDDTYR